MEGVLAALGLIRIRSRPVLGVDNNLGKMYISYKITKKPIIQDEAPEP